MKILFRLLGYLRYHKRPVALGYVGLFGTIGFSSLTPLMLKWAIDVGVVDGNKGTLALAGLLIVAFSIGNGFSTYLQTYMGERIAQSVAFDLRRDFYERVQRLSFSFHDNIETGQLMSRATVDVENCRQFLSMGMLRAVYTFGLFIVVGAIMLLSNWQLACLVFVTIPIVGGIAIYMSSRTRPLWGEVQQQVGVETSVLQESITGMRVVKAFSQEERQFKRFQDANWAVREKSLEAARITSFNQPFLVWILNGVTVILLLYGGHLVIDGAMSIGTLVAFVEYRAQLAAPVRMLGFLVTMGTRAQTSGKRIFEVIDTVSDVAEAPGAVSLSGVEGHVRFEGVSFSYSRRAQVVYDIDIDAQPGETVAHPRADRQRQEHAAEPAPALLRRHGRRDHDRRPRHSLGDDRVAAAQRRRRAAGGLPLHRDDSRQHRLRQAGRDAGRDRGGRESGAHPRLHRVAARTGMTRGWASAG